MGNDTGFKPAQIYKELHGKIKSLAVFNEIPMKVLASKIVACMFDKHKNEIDEIVKELNIKKN